MKKFIRKFVTSALYPSRLTFFYKLQILYCLPKIKHPRMRTKHQYHFARDFIKFRQRYTTIEWELIKKRLLNNADQASQDFLNNYEEKIDYIFSNNVMSQNELFTTKEQNEQAICAKQLKKKLKKLKKYKFFCPSAETFVGYNGLKWLPKEQQEKIKSGICIDGGAYEGDTAIMLINNFNANKVHSFEIEPDIYKKLLKTIKISKSNKIEAKLIGLSDHTSSGYVTGSGGTSLLIEDMSKKDIIIDKLDNLYSPLEKICFIKLDVEGSEQKVIRGAEAIIKRDKPILAISIYHNIDDFFNIKSLIESIQPNYKFMIKKISPFAVLEEVMLIAFYE